MEGILPTFRREVDVPMHIHGSRSNPKHALFLNPFNEGFWDLVVENHHGGTQER